MSDCDYENKVWGEFEENEKITKSTEATVAGAVGMR